VHIDSASDAFENGHAHHDLGAPMVTPTTLRTSTPTDDLIAWIAGLRARLARGDLARLGPIDFGDGLPALPAEHTVLLMLADLDDFEDMAPDEAADTVNAARRDKLLADFGTLQSLFG